MEEGGLCTGAGGSLQTLSSSFHPGKQTGRAKPDGRRGEGRVLGNAWASRGCWPPSVCSGGLGQGTGGRKGCLLGPLGTAATVFLGSRRTSSIA